MCAFYSSQLHLGLGSPVNFDPFDAILFILDELSLVLILAILLLSLYLIRSMAGGSVAFTSKPFSPSDVKIKSTWLLRDTIITRGQKENQAKQTTTTLKAAEISLMAYSHTY